MYVTNLAFFLGVGQLDHHAAAGARHGLGAVQRGYGRLGRLAARKLYKGAACRRKVIEHCTGNWDVYINQPLLAPSGPRRMVHSSIAPNGLKI